jgi:metacaspase-1
VKVLAKLLFSLLMCLTFVVAEAQTKHALIFAIGNYPESGGWRHINSNRDVVFMKNALQRQGFLPQHCEVVEDSLATRAGIRKAMQDLIERVSPGDIVTIHFSSHGVQIQDNNGDEQDQLDESIVPYDALSPLASSDFEKDQAAYFRDDEFGVLIDSLRSKLGRKGDVLVFMDSCHSGSGTRGLAVVRGGQPPFVSKNFVRSSNRDQEATSGISDRSRIDESQLATYVVVSAARASELNYETLDENDQSMGTLTYAVSKALENLEAGTTYRSLFAKMQVIVNRKTPGQNPVLEGTGLDRALFGGQFVEQKPYVEVEEMKGSRLLVRGGLLAGLDEGARIQVHPAGTIDPAKSVPLAMGTVAKAESFSATVRLDHPLKEGLHTGYWVFVTEPVFRIDPVVVQFLEGGEESEGGFSPMEQAVLKDLLKSLSVLKFEGTPDLLISKGLVKDTIKIAANGYVFATLPKITEQPEELKKELQRYTQYKLLQKVDVYEKKAMVEVQFVPVVNQTPDTSRIQDKVVGGTYEYYEGDTLVLWIKNMGNEDLYVNMLDMQPNGIINSVLPNKLQKIYPADLRIPANSSRLFADYFLEVGPPYGTEIYKVFVTRNEIDMEFITTTKGRGESRSTYGFFEQLLKDSYSAATRGHGSRSLGNANGSAYNILFRIKPRE